MKCDVDGFNLLFAVNWNRIRKSWKNQRKRKYSTNDFRLKKKADKEGSINSVDAQHNQKRTKSLGIAQSALNGNWRESMGICDMTNAISTVSLFSGWTADKSEIQILKRIPYTIFQCSEPLIISRPYIFCHRRYEVDGNLWWKIRKKNNKMSMDRVRLWINLT